MVDATLPTATDMGIPALDDRHDADGHALDKEEASKLIDRIAEAHMDLTLGESVARRTSDCIAVGAPPRRPTISPRERQSTGELLSESSLGRDVHAGRRRAACRYRSRRLAIK